MKLSFLKRYVDDLILAVPLNQIDESQSVFNRYNEYLQFTVKGQNYNWIPFGWPRNPRCTNRFIRYHSHQLLARTTDMFTVRTIIDLTLRERIRN